MKKCSFLTIILLSFFALEAQQTGVSRNGAADSAIFTRNQQEGALRPAALILPAGMFTYGVLSLNLHPLKELNHDIHDRTANTLNKAPFQVESYLQWAPGLSVFALHAAGLQGRHDWVDESILFALALGMQATVAYTVKEISGETRPNGQGRLSFPSGHVSNAFMGAEMLRLEYQGISPWPAIGGYAAAITTAALRLYHNKHWFGDVVGGAAVGIFSSELVWLVYPWLKHLVSVRHSNQASVFLPFWQNGAAGLSFVHRFK